MIVINIDNNGHKVDHSNWLSAQVYMINLKSLRMMFQNLDFSKRLELMIWFLLQNYKEEKK